jgi:hypothetical protein
MLIDDLKPVIGGDGGGVDQGRMHTIRDGFSISRGCSLMQINPD